MAVSKEAYRDWRNNSVTQALMEDLRETVETEVAKMINRDIPDQARDQFTRAFVKTADQIISWEPEFPKEEEKDD
mgnify:CR=1 FL=1